MFASAQKTAASSLDALRKIELQILAGLQPILLLQMLGGLSQAVTNSVSHTQALARTFLLNGQQQLRALLAAAPRLPLPLERVLAPSHPSDAEPTPEETAAQALLEVCLGLMLEWIARKSRRPRFNTPPLPTNRRRVFSACSTLSSALYSLKAHLCIAVPLA